MFVSCPFQPLWSSPVAFAQEGFPFSRDDQFASVSDTSLNCFLMNTVKEDTICTSYFILHLQRFHQTALTSLGHARSQARSSLDEGRLTGPQSFLKSVSLGWRASPEYFCTEIYTTMAHLVRGFSASAGGTEARQRWGICCALSSPLLPGPLVWRRRLICQELSLWAWRTE